MSLSSYYVDETGPPAHRRHWLARIGALAAVIVAVSLIGTMAAAISAGRSRPPAAPAAYPTAEPPLPAPSGSGDAPEVRVPGAGTPDAASPTPPVKTNPPAQPVPAPEGLSSAEAAVFMIVNQERAKVAGCKPLTVDSRLTLAARRHSADMAARGYFDHTTPEGVAFATRITRAGYRWSTAGENIAKGQQTAASVMRAWMNSPGHRANILNCKYRNIGVGLAYSPRREPVWTQDFATPLR